jgi:ferredoxin
MLRGDPRSAECDVRPAHSRSPENSEPTRELRVNPREEESRMAWVITRMCRDCVDQACVEVCPVDCIYAYDGDDADTFPNQLYIDPEECINCGVCEPECPWEAIFEDEQVPDIFQEDIGLNAKVVDGKDAFSVPEVEEKPKPTPEQIDENKSKWGYSA